MLGQLSGLAILARQHGYTFKYQYLHLPTCAREWLVLWQAHTISFYRACSSGRRYLESAGTWRIARSRLYLDRWACAPLHGLQRQDDVLTRLGPPRDSRSLLRPLVGKLSLVPSYFVHRQVVLTNITCIPASQAFTSPSTRTTNAFGLCGPKVMLSFRRTALVRKPKSLTELCWHWCGFAWDWTWAELQKRGICVLLCV